MKLSWLNGFAPGKGKRPTGARKPARFRPKDALLAFLESL